MKKTDVCLLLLGERLVREDRGDLLVGGRLLRREGPVELRRLAAGGLGLGWKVRSARDRTIRTFQIRVRSKLCQNSGNFARIHRKSKTLIKIQDFETFSRTIGEIPPKFHQNLSKLN